MWDWTKLVNLSNIWEEKWSGKSTVSPDLKIIFYDDALRITSGNYTQSKKLTNDNLTSGYWYYQANALQTGSDDPDILILGFGGGTIGTILKQRYPHSRVDAVEIDSMMIDLGEKYLGLRKKDFNIIIADAVKYVDDCQKKYDYIGVDLYLEDVVPKQVNSQPFYHKLKKMLKKDGLVTINRIFEIKSPGLMGQAGYDDYMKLLKSVFSEVEVVEVPNEVSTKNYIFIGR